VAAPLRHVSRALMPAPRYRDIEEADAPVFTEMRRFLEQSTEGVPDVEFALWMVATAAHAVIHNGIVERPEDVANGRLVDELVVLLTRYLKRRRVPGADRSDRS
jgi:tetracycline repressor-like protein